MRGRAPKRKRGNDLCYTSGEQSPQPVYSTQEDPIGLAGGMNLYGYAAGDPINFYDPFGLCARVTVDGKNVRIEANLVVQGADHTKVASAIASHWQGKHGGFNVTVDLNVKDAPTITAEFWGDGKDAPDGAFVGSGDSDGANGGSMEVLISLQVGLIARLRTNSAMCWESSINLLRPSSWIGELAVAGLIVLTF